MNYASDLHAPFLQGEGEQNGDRARPHYNKLIFGLWGEFTRFCCETLRGGSGQASLISPRLFQPGECE